VSERVIEACVTAAEKHRVDQLSVGAWVPCVCTFLPLVPGGYFYLK